MKQGNAKKGIIDKVLLPNSAWAMLLLIPITFLGFYPSYFSTFKAPLIIHVHGALMLLWLAMVLIQIWLIKLHKIPSHKIIGRFSYFIMPFILLSGYLVLRYGYMRVLGGDIVASPDYYPEGASQLTKAADFVVIGSVYFAWLLMYFTLGVLFRNKTHIHATFMLAASLTILGPAGDRAIGILYYLLGWRFNSLAENFTFGFILLLFTALLWYHRKQKLSLWPTLTVLATHLLGIFLYHNMPFHPAWDAFANLIFSTF